jgi:ATP-dependent exoDNAse (exonuclease V) beta subunit
MSVRPFTLYRSSAGSGKTRTLAKAYLQLALQYRSGYFRHILAVTFTNKATQEMKDRILSYLHHFSSGREQSLAAELMHELALTPPAFLERCREVQRDILHNYNQFSISTIDAFFQRVIRAFTRESGLMGDYRLEVDQDLVLEEVINNLMDELGKNPQLTRWMVEFARENLESDKPWDVRVSLQDFAKEIFKEEFKRIEDELLSATADKNFFTAFQEELRKKRNGFIHQVRGAASEALQLMAAADLNPEDFKWGQSGPGAFFAKMARLNQVHSAGDLGSRPYHDYQHPKNWPGKNLAKQQRILQLAQDRFIPLLNTILQLRGQQYSAALSAELTLTYFYAFGLVADVSRKLREYKQENNMMLLADAPKFLNEIIRDSDTPFIYEKVGSFYRNFLIDEFQDTSVLQWKNFYPLVMDSLAQGNTNLVVGDVKQAIYRWRGGDLRLLQQRLEQEVGTQRMQIEQLATNYRSSPQVVMFNNELFKVVAQRVAADTEAAEAREVYRDVEQRVAGNTPGYVHLQFFDHDNERTWKQMALDALPRQLEQLQDAGVPLHDVAILVRRNDEGQQIVQHLLDYKNSGKAKPNYVYEVVSNESLRLDMAASVNLLLSALRYLHDPADGVARATLAFELARIHHLPRPLPEVLAVANQTVFESYLPEVFTRQKNHLRKLSLVELTETLIEVFDLGRQTGELAYLLAFQDLMLNFNANERKDLQKFLEWWEENKHSEKTSLKSSGRVNAVQLLTVHKSKGLEFAHVLIPFCSWEMDSIKSSTLWVQAEGDAFTYKGYVPVRYSSQLTDSHFAGAYQKERVSNYLDNLNLLYVAFTRAERGLWVCAPVPKGHNANVVGALVHEALKSHELFRGGWQSDTEWRSGNLEIAVPEQNPADKMGSESFHHFPSGRWREKLIIRQDGKKFFSEETDLQKKISYGVQVHAVLSAIQTTHDVKEALNRLAASGAITQAERQQVEHQVNLLLSEPQVAEWFSGQWKVRTEVPILVPNASESRIDRLMTRGSHAVVVDFKTGAASRDHQRQVSHYMELVKQMGFLRVEGYVVYVETATVVEVQTGKATSSKRKNTDQLELGL